MSSAEVSRIIQQLAEALVKSPDDAALRRAMAFAVGEGS